MDNPKEKAARGNERRCDPTDSIRTAHGSTPEPGFLRVCGYWDKWKTPRHGQRIVFDVRASHVERLEPIIKHERFRVPGQPERTMLHVLHRGCVGRVVVDASISSMLEQLERIAKGGAA